MYGNASAPLQRYREYQAGEEAEISASFVPRLVGGSYRVTITVTSSDTRDILLADSEGLVFYVPAREYTWGIAELGAELSVDGTPLNRDDTDTPPAGLTATH